MGGIIGNVNVQPHEWQDMKSAISGSDDHVLYVTSGGCSHNLKPIKNIKKELVPPAVHVKHEHGAPVAGF